MRGCEFPGKVPHQRVADRTRRKRHRKKSQLPPFRPAHHGAASPRHQLPAQAEAEHRLALASRRPHEAAFPGEVGKPIVLPSALRPAPEREPVETLQRHRHPFAGIGVEHLERHAGFGQRVGEQPRFVDFPMLEEQHPFHAAMQNRGPPARKQKIPRMRAFRHCKTRSQSMTFARVDHRNPLAPRKTMSRISKTMPAVTEDEAYVDPADYSRAEVNAPLTAEQKTGFYREMLRIRRFEQVALKYYNQGAMGGFLHLYIGQEAVAVGTVSLLGKDDHVITAYRDHGHALAVGMGMNECMAELFGKATGCSRGKGGSMHFFAPDKNYWGGHGIVGGQTPLGLGLAYALKYKGAKGCALCYLGDGAVNQGAYHESLNLAALWKLPVIYIIENNKYSMGTTIDRSSAMRNCLAERADGYGIVWDIANGEDLYEVRAKTANAMRRAHEESLPTVLEVDTYRYYGHSVADANAKKYRSADEIERYKNHHDPIRLWKKRLLAEGVLTEAEAEAIDEEVKAETNAAAAFALESEAPAPETIFEDVYWEVDNNTEAGSTGRHFFGD